MLGAFKYYQWAVLLLSAVMMYFGLEKFLRREAGQTILKLASRLIIWGGMSAVALVPDLTNYLAHFIGLEGNINAVILIGFILVFLLIFKTLSAVERVEAQISVLTRTEALKNLSLKNVQTRKN